MASAVSRREVLTYCILSSQCISSFQLFGFAQKVDPIWNEPVITGNAGALARDEREARNSYIVKKVDTERAAHAVRARAPALPVLGCLFQPQHFLGKATLPRSLAYWALNIERGR